jgi:hypothetical protein
MAAHQREKQSMQIVSIREELESFQYSDLESLIATYDRSDEFRTTIKKRSEKAIVASGDASRSL